VPEYRIDEAGPDHAKTFTAWVIVAGERYGGEEGRSKKEAEQRAAEAAWRVLSEDSPGPVATAPGPPSPNGAKPAEAGTRAEADAVVDDEEVG